MKNKILIIILVCAGLLAKDKHESPAKVSPANQEIIRKALAGKQDIATKKQVISAHAQALDAQERFFDEQIDKARISTCADAGMTTEKCGPLDVRAMEVPVAKPKDKEKKAE